MRKSMIHGRDLLKKSGRWSIGYGVEITLTEDKWLVNGEREVLNQDSDVTVVSELIDDYHNWNLEALRKNLNPPYAISALQTPISWSNPIDTLYWPFTRDGEYSVKSGYKKV